MLSLYELVENSINLENKISKFNPKKAFFNDSSFLLLLQKISRVQAKMLKQRQALKKQADILEAMERYTIVKEYLKGDFFGELALLYG